MTQQFIAQASAPRDLWTGQHLAFKFKEAVIGAVICLLSPCRPSTITGLVIAGLIGKAIQGVRATGTFAHVGKEIFENAPALADGNPEPLIMLKPGTERLGAAGNHRFPGAVAGGDSSARGVSVFPALAAAVEISSRVQVRAEAKNLFAAIAATIPAGGCPLIWAARKHGQITNALASKIAERAHSIASHSVESV